LLVPILFDLLKPKSVLDVGCSRGPWLRAWKQQQPAPSVLGVDGPYVDQNTLYVDRAEFLAHDMSNRLDLGQTFEVVTSFETAEHLDPSRSRTFVSDLCRHGDIVLFSAAQPGQGGEHHINERPLSFWAKVFKEHGYQAYDVRGFLQDASKADPWYRYNMLLYARDGRELPPAISAKRVASADNIARVMSRGWRLRLAIGRLIPTPVGTAIAKALAWGNSHGA
jgi:cyclopropane fatty-acyl-phospholipid synthase-like methyltransferase